MKKRFKIICVMVLFVQIIFLLQNLSLGAWNPATEISNAGGSWVTGASGKDGGLVSSTQNIVGTVINVIRIVGTGIAIIMLTYVAIKYMSAAPSEKAEIKKSVTIYVVGAIVLFSASALLGIVKSFAINNIGG